MRFRRRSHQLALRSVAVALAGIALATPPALAQQDPPAGLTEQEQQVLASRGVGAPAGLTEQEQQVLASRGIGAPSPPADTAPAQSSDASFDLGSAAVGAAAAAGLIALVSLGAPAVLTRRRLRTAR